MPGTFSPAFMVELYQGANSVAIAVSYSANHEDIVKCKAVSPGTTADSSRRGSILITERNRCLRPQR